MGDPTMAALATTAARTLSYTYNGNSNATGERDSMFASFSYTPTTTNPTSLFGESSVTVSGGRGFLTMAYAYGPRVNHAMVSDLLWVSTEQADTVGTTSLPSGTLPARDRNGSTNGVGVDLVACLATTSGATSSTSSTLTASYTNSAGASGRTATFAFLAGGAVGHNVVRAQLQSGDVGVRSLDSITFGGTAATCKWHFALMRVLKYHPSNLPIDSMGGGVRKSAPLTMLTEIYDGTVLWPMARWTSSLSNARNIFEYDVKVV